LFQTNLDRCLGFQQLNTQLIRAHPHYALLHQWLSWKVFKVPSEQTHGLLQLVPQSKGRRCHVPVFLLDLPNIGKVRHVVLRQQYGFKAGRQGLPLYIRII
jgi:hypothetical protein